MPCSDVIVVDRQHAIQCGRVQLAQVFVVEAEAEVMLAGELNTDIRIPAIEAATSSQDRLADSRLTKREAAGVAAGRVRHVVERRIRRQRVAPVLTDAISARQRQEVRHVAGVASHPVETALLLAAQGRIGLGPAREVARSRAIVGIRLSRSSMSCRRS